VTNLQENELRALKIVHKNRLSDEE